MSVISEEEKEAIEDIDLLVHCLNYGEMKMTIASERQKEIAQELQMLLNLLNKQQKEIEELKDIQQEACEKEIINQKHIKENYISKDKIREAIKNREIELYADNPEDNFIPFDKVIDTLKELLEEK
jgi:hypothetical protein